jgi:hypothetical protein
MAGDTPRPEDRSEDNPEMQGEGNRTAARHYNEATKRFVEQGKVGPAAEAARPDSPEQQREMERAEQEGKSHAKEEDPALRKGGGQDSGIGRPGGGRSGV